MKAFSTLFLDHPRAVGESYFEHLGLAMQVAGLLLAAGAACSVHALAPALFPTTASRTITALNARIRARAQRRAADQGSDLLGADCYSI